MNNPVISIITATYNRSNILGFSIRSVLNQSYQDWELIVVGDCCTDDTELVVNDFQDPRITFINLKENFGEQSGPNNVGLKQAKGDVIAFLNHDDLWFPDHLEYSLSVLRSSQADLVVASGFIDHHQEHHEFYLSGILSEKYGYHPSRTFVPASNWLFKRELIRDVGFWRPAKEIYLAPSHDWLKRVYEAAKRIEPTRHFTVIALPSSSRKNAYKDRMSFDSQHYFDELLHNPRFREQLAIKYLYNSFEKNFYDEKTYCFRFFTKRIKTAFIKLGFNTIEFSYWRTYGKGGWLANFRQKRGLN
ncbi:glycosyltransferase [Dyadobacter sp. CY261]|uniref:glycosyltransferase family 2 protein n=1 Tax=Dyadobacter sp. CY261 TaxID=2907203 RepID=UPI001F2F205D|nr:glycosyltransferase family 2 protein [Dyadobacter sp. CY261]MCF0072568.1 glycosyltransferase [Dyadobacter sp. CY261]